MTYHSRQDETAEWLNYLQPEGLVVGANVLREIGVTPIRQTPLDTEAAALALRLDPEAPRDHDRLHELHDAWTFFEQVLGWPAKLVAGSPGGPAIDPALSATVLEHETLLAPDLVLLWNGEAPEGIPAQALVMLHPGLDADGRGQFTSGEWEATPHQRLERLLRERNIGVGILVARNTLRLIYAPRGETAGWLSWPLAALGRVEGRPMLAGLKLCLGRNAFFTGAPETRLRKLLEASREAQNAVSEKLSGQVLGALYELLRGLHRAAPQEIEAIAERDPHHLYEGLLTCLMRLVFLLYAEDRDLLPSSTDPHLKQLWENGYSIKTLYTRLLVDEALNPDTMDERRGGWGQLLAVFRLIHRGHSDWVTGRGGKLFDPDGFPFLEGREKGSWLSYARVLPVSDGTILRILHGLMTIEGSSLSGEKIRERLSYRTLDVESIGSVYETVMGFTARRATERMIALRDEKKLPNFIGLEALMAQKPNDRQKWLKDCGIRLSAKQAKGVKEASSIAALIEAFGSLVDDRASPKATPIGPGAPYLQPTEERRRSGSHYTPRSLTEPIVRHALEPAFARLGDAASPEAVLSLRVLDPACGSGAFLVEACRHIGARLEQAWNKYGAEKPQIPADEDEALHARRLVAQKCLYGVDKNPMAVDLARLSLWLATLARDHEFTFVDHALKAGDSLVGLTRAEIQAAHWDPSKPGLPLFRETIEKAVNRALEGREAIRNAGDDVLIEAQAARHARVVDASGPARIVGDAVIAAHFSADKPREREAERQKVESWIVGSLNPDWDRLRAKTDAFRVQLGWRPFHWEIEFPEVFVRDNPGFDAIVGNPPFLGGKRISTSFGNRYADWLSTVHIGASQNVDLVGHFFRRAFLLLRNDGCFGLVATNTIAQGATREGSLVPLLRNGGSITSAIRRMPWPGEAAVVVSIIHLKKGIEPSPKLDGRAASRISAFLIEGSADDSPKTLAANADQAFVGSYVLGVGFTFDDTEARTGEATTLAEMQALLDGDPKNADVIEPFLGGDEINNDPQHRSHRFVINFRDFPLRRELGSEGWAALDDDARKEALRTGIVPGDYPDSVAEDWPKLLSIVEKKVRPLRQRQDRRALKDRWWRFADQKEGLYSRIKANSRVIAVGQTAKYILFTYVPTGITYSHKTIIFVRESASLLACLQSRVHLIWAHRFGSTMKDDPVYTPSDCFETFPFPTSREANPLLEAAGHSYYAHRAALMISANEGMTQTYNRFHSSRETSESIRLLRELHDDIDRALLRAYGWDDLAAELHPQFLTEQDEDDHTYQNRYFWPAKARDRVLARLLALNAERHAAEVAEGRVPVGRELAGDGGDDETEPQLSLD
jgi:hypothetical protein